MKFTIVVVFYSLSVVFATSNAENPCEGIDLGFVNDYTSCSHYFSCVSGRAFPKICPDGRWFYNNGCHLPRTVPCEICPTEGVVRVGVPQSCTEYILCINGHESERECAEGTRFDPNEGRCNLAELVPCEYARCPPEGRDLQPDPTSCRHYLVCFDGVEVGRRECNENLLFDPELGSCALPDRVNCGSRPNRNGFAPNAPIVNPRSKLSAFIGDVPTAPTATRVVPTAPTATSTPRP